VRNTRYRVPGGADDSRKNNEIIGGISEIVEELNSEESNGISTTRKKGRFIGTPVTGNIKKQLRGISRAVD